MSAADPPQSRVGADEASASEASDVPRNASPSYGSEEHATSSSRHGDGFLRCSDGHVRWGRFGAAGVLFVTGEGAERRVMLQKRSAWAHEGGTWSVAGGALDADETPLDGALREATEEIGVVPDFRLLGEYVFAPADDWTYTTVVVEVDAPFGESRNFETDAVGWFRPDEVDTLALHAGFVAAWPFLRDLAEPS